MNSKYLLIIIFALFVFQTVNADNDLFVSKKSSKLKTAVIEGKVVDLSTREELVCASVKLNNKEKEICTDINGTFRFEDLEPGKYEITVNYISYEEKKILNIKARSEKTENLTIELKSL